MPTPHGTWSTLPSGTRSDDIVPPQSAGPAMPGPAAPGAASGGFVSGSPPTGLGGQLFGQPGAWGVRGEVRWALNYRVLSVSSVGFVCASPPTRLRGQLFGHPVEWGVCGGYGVL